MLHCLMCVCCIIIKIMDDVTTLDEFNIQLATVDGLIDRNPDCHVVLGGDFNVDFSRNWTHESVFKGEVMHI